MNIAFINKRTAVALSLVVMLVSCDGASIPSGLSQSDHIETVRSALSTIPECAELEKLHPEADHYISHYGMSGPNIMNSEVWLDNGICIVIQFRISIDYSNNTVSKARDPKFYIKQYRKIRIQENGNMAADIGKSNNFTSDQWNQYVASGGNIGYLGDYDESRRLKHWDQYVDRWTSGRLILEE